MSFLSPLMLFGALAAAIPVIIHLFFRSRYRTVPWAAMKFLLTAVEQTSRRLRFQELLLLLLRMALLVMLALAFARPVSSISRGAGRGDSVDAVFVFDTSFSMAANDGDNKTRLMRAKEEALKIIDELPSHSTVQIIACAGNAKTLLGPRSPANLDEARRLIEDKNFDIAHLATDLAGGVIEAKEVLFRGQASNKELYVFSDMQKLGFDQQTSELRQSLQEVKDKAVVHFVRCGTRPVKNVAIVGIVPQSGVPRPGDRVGFAVLVKNTGSESVENLTVSLAVDGDDKNRETTAIAKLPPKETRAVTLNGKLEKAGLRVLTAKVGPDDLPADNQFDQVILVREQVNILVVDGAYKESKPAESSSYFLMHALLPVRDNERATYHLQPRVVSARLASPALLSRQDICILVNCSLQAKAGSRTETVPADFVDALEPFVRAGHGLIIFGGDNVQPDVYSKLLYQKHKLLPMPIKGVEKAQGKAFMVDRGSFGLPAFWRFRDDGYYEDFSKVEIWRHLVMDESGVPFKMQDNEVVENLKKDENPVSVILRLNTAKALIASRKVDAGEVIFVGTAADFALDERTLNPTWTNWPLLLGMYVPFMDVMTTHLLQGQTQTYNLVAGQTLTWYPTDRQNNVYDLIDPKGDSIRLGQPEKAGKRLVVIANDLPRAGVYRMTSLPRGSDTAVTTVNTEAKTGTPIAVVPDLRESEDLTTLSDAQIDQQLGFTPIHITAGVDDSASLGADRLNREWTVWVLLIVLAMALVEIVLAWWCGKAW